MNVEDALRTAPVPSPPAQMLNGHPLAAFKRLFGELALPERSALAGIYRAEFTGPGWLRRLAGPSLALAHFAGWCGKELLADDCGQNLFLRHGKLQRGFPFRLQERPSALDGRPSLVVVYARDAAFPWPLMADELRQYQPGCLLGLTYADRPGLHQLVFPFLLHAISQ